MTDTPHPSNPPHAPIADSNRNGVLDGADLRSALQREDSRHALPAHEILEFAGIRDIVKHYNIAIVKGDGVLTDQKKKELAMEIENALSKTLLDTKQFLKDHPKDAEQVAESALRHGPNVAHLSPKALQRLLHDQKSFLEFTRSFGQAFSQAEIHIGKEDVADILGHFDALVPRNPQAQPTLKKLPPSKSI